MNRKLVAIVTGMQHSGTTYLNNVINSHQELCQDLNVEYY